MRYLILILCIGVFNTVRSQNCAGVGRTPSTAIPICGQTIFQQSQLPSCQGIRFVDALCGTTTYSSDNSIWYKFTCYQSGTLGFLITPNNLSDDYDWSVFDITNNQPSNVFTGDLYVSINLSGLRGITGSTPGGVGAVNCAGFSQYNSLINVYAGREYLLMITNYSNSGQGYNIEFTGGTADITNETLPVLDSVRMIGCNNSEVSLFFSKEILCSSISSTGSEFSISGTSIPVTSGTLSCTNNNYASKIVTIQMQSPLPQGTYSLSINNGSDGNTVMDICNNPTSPGQLATFSVGTAPTPQFSSIEYNHCKPLFVKLNYNKPISCNSIAADGSDFQISNGSTPVAISHVQVDSSTCNEGYTDWVIINFTTPVDQTGNYAVNIQVGSDGNGIADTCLNFQELNDQIDFNLIESPSTNFTHSVLWGCSEDTILLSHAGQPDILSYQWHINNTIYNGQNIQVFFPANTDIVSIKLIVQNNSCTDSSVISIPLGNAFTVGFNVIDTLCVGKAVTFENLSEGQNLQYEWRFGDNSFSTDFNPPLHIYSSATNYSVQLIASNFTGCRDTADKTIHAVNTASLSYTGLNAKICTNTQVNLQAITSGNFSNFLWETGDSAFLTLSPELTFDFKTEGNKTVKLSSEDRYCGIVSHAQTTNAILTPQVDLGKDINTCPEVSKLIGIAPIVGYSYLWNTGQTSPSISVENRSFEYKLTVENQGCIASDEISVRHLSNCTIIFPNIFTPNNDGRNDIFKALNADLVLNLSWKIFDRYGKVVFETENPSKGWDGRYKSQNAEMGTYIWLATFTKPGYSTKIFEKGSFVLIR